jgi:phosphoadenosine phosphosulfate reductase
VATAPALPDLDFEAMSAEDVLHWAYGEFGARMCLTCSWQRQSSALVHMVSELGLAVPIVELDTQLFFKETYETRDRLVERYGLELEREPVALDETVARLEGLLEEELRIELDLSLIHI